MITAMPNDAAERVKQLQRELNAKGYILDVDGLLGPKTLRALRGDARRSAMQSGSHEEAIRLSCLREAVALRPNDADELLHVAKRFEQYVLGVATEKPANSPLVVSEAALQHGLVYALNYLGIDAKSGQADHTLAADMLPLVLHGMGSWVRGLDPAMTPNKWPTPNKSPDPEQVRSGAVGVR